ncbi:MAG TPA: molybdopterin-binding protein [Haliangiales bacterium]|nr:molybdopterin-binding protein [Haliangiales bacterium]
MDSPTAAAIIIGDEILSGKFAEENAAFLVRELRDLGIALRRIEVIPDDVDEIAGAVRAASARFDHVFTSGGVGPTHDDKTMEGVARAFGVRVVVEPGLAAALRAFYGDRFHERHLRMAEVPEGATMIPADHAAWPVTSIKNVYILPGVPAIFRRKLEAIRERFRARPFAVRRVYCMADEATIAPHLDAIVAAFPAVAVGSYPRFDAADYRVLVTLESKDRAAVDAATEALAARLPAGIVVRVE